MDDISDTSHKMDLNQLIVALSHDIKPVPERRVCSRPGSNRRHNERYQIDALGLDFKCRSSGSQTSLSSCRIDNVSDGGLRFQSDAAFQMGEEVEIVTGRTDGSSFKRKGKVCNKSIISSGIFYGVQFLKTLPILAALMVPLPNTAIAAELEHYHQTSVSLPLFSGESRKYLHYDDKQRFFEVHLPKTYNGEYAIPLVLAFHPSHESIARFKTLTSFNRLSDELDKGFIVVYPEAMDTQWSIGVAEIDQLRNVDDTKFVVELLRYAEKHYTINEQQVYLAGLSQGKIFAYKLMHYLSSIEMFEQSETKKNGPLKGAESKTNNTIDELSDYQVSELVFQLLGEENKLAKALPGADEGFEADNLLYDIERQEMSSNTGVENKLDNILNDWSFELSSQTNEQEEAQQAIDIKDLISGFFTEMA